LVERLQHIVKVSRAFIAADRRVSYVDLNPNLFEDLVKFCMWPALLVLLDHVPRDHLSALLGRRSDRLFPTRQVSWVLLSALQPRDRTRWIGTRRPHRSIHRFVATSLFIVLLCIIDYGLIFLNVSHLVL